MKSAYKPFYLICSEFHTSSRVKLPIEMATLNSFSRDFRTYRHTIEKQHELVFENLDTGEIETEYLHGSYKIYIREGVPTVNASGTYEVFESVITSCIYDYVHCMTGKGPKEFDFNLDKRSDIHRRRNLCILLEDTELTQTA